MFYLNPKTSLIGLTFPALMFIVSAPSMGKTIPQSFSRDGRNQTNLQPATSVEIASAVVGRSIDESPYPTDSGPLNFLSDRKVQLFWFGGARVTEYRIVGNRILVGPEGHQDVLTFYKDRSGALYYDHGYMTSHMIVPLRIK